MLAGVYSRDQDHVVVASRRGANLIIHRHCGSSLDRGGTSEHGHRLGRRWLRLILVAPYPHLSGLDRADKRVLSGIKVFSRVFVF